MQQQNILVKHYPAGLKPRQVESKAVSARKGRSFHTLPGAPVQVVSRRECARSEVTTLSSKKVHSRACTLRMGLLIMLALSLLEPWKTHSLFTCPTHNSFERRRNKWGDGFKISGQSHDTDTSTHGEKGLQARERFSNFIPEGREGGCGDLSGQI